MPWNRIYLYLDLLDKMNFLLSVKIFFPNIASIASIVVEFCMVADSFQFPLIKDHPVFLLTDRFYMNRISIRMLITQHCKYTFIYCFYLIVWCSHAKPISGSFVSNKTSLFQWYFVQSVLNSLQFLNLLHWCIPHVRMLISWI